MDSSTSVGSADAVPSSSLDDSALSALSVGSVANPMQLSDKGKRIMEVEGGSSSANGGLSKVSTGGCPTAQHIQS